MYLSLARVFETGAEYILTLLIKSKQKQSPKSLHVKYFVVFVVLHR